MGGFDGAGMASISVVWEQFLLPKLRRPSQQLRAITDITFQQYERQPLDGMIPRRVWNSSLARICRNPIATIANTRMRRYAGDVGPHGNFPLFMPGNGGHLASNNNNKQPSISIRSLGNAKPTH
jgi:hypothetical protein